jgi:hypothetical protein
MWTAGSQVLETLESPRPVGLVKLHARPIIMYTASLCKLPCVVYCRAVYCLAVHCVLLQHAAEVLGARHVVVRGDSQLAVRQMQGRYK